MSAIRETVTRRPDSRGGREPSYVSPSWAQPFALGAGKVVLAGLAIAGLIGCGAETALDRTATSSAGAAAEETRPEDSSPQQTGNEVDPTAEAPGIPPGTYPEPPYGTVEGATIENLELFGWRDPVAVAFDLATASKIRLGDFYNTGAAGEGTEYILLNAVTAWCGVCRSEYQHMKDDQTYQKFAARGLEIVGVLFEDNNGDPSTYQDMTNWARSFSVSFPFVNDPGFKTGIFFDKSATPMNMLIDARSMEIVLVMTGYNPLMYDQVDRLLAERGR